MKAENYKTEITLEELKGHYKTHFLTAGQFMDLVKKWHADVSGTLQWCYNYIDKQKNSDEKTALIKELKNKGIL